MPSLMILYVLSLQGEDTLPIAVGSSYFWRWGCLWCNGCRFRRPRWGACSFHHLFSFIIYYFLVLIVVTTMKYACILWSDMWFVPSLSQSTGGFYAVSRLAGATPPPPYVISRGIGWQGIGLLLNGFWGTFTGTTVAPWVPFPDWPV